MKKLVLAGLLAVMVMVLFALPAAAKVGGSNGRVVFSRYDPATDDNFTYTANPDGSNPQPLFPSFNSSSPRWSPNGTEVAVNSGLDFPCCSGHTVIINPDTGAFRVVIPDGPPVVFPFCTIWSPNATRFACEAFNDDDPSVNGVYTVRSSDGGDLKRVTNGPDNPIDYSPDGTKIVFGRDAHNCVTKSALYVVNVDGTGLHRITPYGFCDDVGGWSPDGKWIVFARSVVQRDGSQFHFGPPTGKLFVVHPDGSGLKQVVLQAGVGAFDASWSPDGKKIIFGYYTSTAEGIATANADGSDVQEVTTSLTGDHAADWGTHPIVGG